MTGDFEASDALVRWSALSEPGDRISGALAKQCPELVEDLAWLNIGDPGKLLASRLDVSGMEHALGAFVNRLRLRSPEVNPTSLRERAGLQGALPIPVASLPERLKSNLGRLGVAAPILVWVAGNVTAFAQPHLVGIVGSRLPTDYSRRVINSLVAAFSRPMSVISGGALGVDTIAHRSAVELAVPTVAVLAGGIDRPYPPANAQLFDEIRSNGGILVSEVPPGTAPTKWRFLQRNRLIAASVDALVVTEAGTRSGARNTVHHANECGTRVLIVPGAIDSECSRGTNAMLADQLGELLLEPSNLESMLTSKLDSFPPLVSTGEKISANTSSSEIIRLLDSLSQPLTTREIALESGLDVSEVVEAAEKLLISGRLAKVGERWVRLPCSKELHS